MIARLREPLITSSISDMLCSPSFGARFSKSCYWNANRVRQVSKNKQIAKDIRRVSIFYWPGDNRIDVGVQPVESLEGMEQMFDVSIKEPDDITSLLTTQLQHIILLAFQKTQERLPEYIESINRTSQKLQSLTISQGIFEDQ